MLSFAFESETSLVHMLRKGIPAKGPRYMLNEHEVNPTLKIKSAAALSWKKCSCLEQVQEYAERQKIEVCKSEEC